MSIWRHPDVRQFVRYAIVGLAQNGANVAVFAVEIALGVPFVLAAAIAAIASLALSFALNRRWTFPGADDRPTARAVRFVVIWVSFVAVALPTLALLVDVAHLPRVMSQALIVFVGAPLSYFAQRRWTFGAAGGSSSSAAQAQPVAPSRPDERVSRVVAGPRG